MASMMSRKKILQSSFATQAQAMSQDKNSSCPTAIIIGGGPAGMITGLALTSIGFQVTIYEQLSKEEINHPPLRGGAHGPAEPLIFSPASLGLLQKWGLYRSLPGYKQVHASCPNYMWGIVWV